MAGSSALDVAVLALMVGAGFALESGLTAAPVEPLTYPLAAAADADADGVPDLFDGCPGVANRSPLDDRDSDGLRDRCDLDPTGEGVLLVPLQPG